MYQIAEIAGFEEYTLGDLIMGRHHSGHDKTKN